MSGFTEEVLYGGVDIGGSHVGVCLINKSCTIVASIEEANTEQEIADSDAMIEKILRLLNTVQEQRRSSGNIRLAAFGIGCPGQPKDGVLVAASSFPLWKNVPFVSIMGSKLNIPGTILNDVDAALASEYWGHPSVYSDVNCAVMIAMGTGVGYSVVIESKQHLGHFGMLEGGHMIINPHSERLCGCGQYGCIEAYTSAKNVAMKYETDYYAANPCPISERKTFNAKDVFDRAYEGDPLAEAVVDEAADYLAVFAINISRMIDPEVIVFAGGMANAGDRLLSRVQNHFNRRTWTVLPSLVKLKIAESIDDAGMRGAAVAARKYLE